MRACVWALLVAAAVSAAAAHRSRSDQDFEFDDDAEMLPTAAAAAAAAPGGGASNHSRRPRRYLYDPHNPLCRALACKKREVCVVRDAATAAVAPPRALCAYKKDLLRRGDIIVAATRTGDEWDNVAAERDDDEDVFYEGGGGAGGGEAESDVTSRGRGRLGPARCVGCPVRVRARGQFLCGSDNRTYSSLCRLDLHNCVRRPAPAPVRLQCRGFCPCAAPAPDPAPDPPRRQHHRPRAHARGAARRYYDDDWRRRKSESSHNEVLPERTTRRRLSQSQGSEGCALDKMANRLLDWFSVVMEEAGASLREETGAGAGFPADCKPEVRWMFAHLDTDADGTLSADNLYALRHDERERCLRPFLSGCGAEEGEGAGAGVSRAAWCACLAGAARPCTALARAHAAPAPGAYVPACDARGYYRPRQCHAALAVCWCVDAHGVEVPGSRTKGAPSCPRADPDPDPGEGEGAPADDEDGAGALGSGDAELRF